MKKILLFILLIIISSCGEDKELNQNKVIRKEYKGTISNSIGMDLVYIKPGSFIMGPDYKMDYIGRENEHPHKVTLTKGYYIQTTETTVAQWRQFIKETGYKTHAEQVGFSWFQLEKFEYNQIYPKMVRKKKFWDHSGNTYPVTQVTWVDCQVFLKWLSSKENENYRLPTEAEWEYACRANEKTHFPGGNLTDKWRTCECDTENPELDKVAWYNMNSGKNAHPVKLKAPNKWGLYDMVGNVTEYCQDTFTRSFPKEPITDPVHLYNTGYLSENDKKVSKGGSWFDPEYFVTSSTRDGSLIVTCDNISGFRVVKDLSVNDIKKAK